MSSWENSLEEISGKVYETWFITTPLHLRFPLIMHTTLKTLLHVRHMNGHINASFSPVDKALNEKWNDTGITLQLLARKERK